MRIPTTPIGNSIWLAHLASGGNEDQDRLEGRVGLYSSIGWLVHSGHTRTVKLARVALNVALQGHWPHTGLEVEQALHSRATTTYDRRN